jgi:hypothetical protein
MHEYASAHAQPEIYPAGLVYNPTNQVEHHYKSNNGEQAVGEGAMQALRGQP